MALKLPVTLPSGAPGDYIRIGVFEFNREARSVYAQLALFKNEAQARNAPRFPLAVVALLELRKEKFDQYFGGPALAAAGHNITAQLYKAAREQQLRPINDIVLDNVATALDV
jgi:hypothetical protein